VLDERRRRDRRDALGHANRVEFVEPSAQLCLVRGDVHEASLREVAGRRELVIVALLAERSAARHDQDRHAGL
jgi:hypothetical protein